MSLSDAMAGLAGASEGRRARYRRRQLDALEQLVREHQPVDTAEVRRLLRESGDELGVGGVLLVDRLEELRAEGRVRRHGSTRRDAAEAAVRWTTPDMQDAVREAHRARQEDEMRKTDKVRAFLADHPWCTRQEVVDGAGVAHATGLLSTGEKAGWCVVDRRCRPHRFAAKGVELLDEKVLIERGWAPLQVEAVEVPQVDVPQVRKLVSKASVVDDDETPELCDECDTGTLDSDGICDTACCASKGWGSSPSEEAVDRGEDPPCPSCGCGADDFHDEGCPEEAPEVEAIDPESPTHCERCAWKGTAGELVGEVKACPSCRSPWDVTEGAPPTEEDARDKPSAQPDRPWWDCSHGGIGLPGCPTCDARLTPEGKHALVAARREIMRLHASQHRSRDELATRLRDELGIEDVHGAWPDDDAIVESVREVLQARSDPDAGRFALALGLEGVEDLKLDEALAMVRRLAGVWRDLAALILGEEECDGPSVEQVERVFCRVRDLALRSGPYIVRRPLHPPEVVWVDRVSEAEPWKLTRPGLRTMKVEDLGAGCQLVPVEVPRG